ncbi:MAG: 7-carboxy-7-deazaguanine synthase QueE [Chitinophagaceae bacterium]
MQKQQITYPVMETFYSIQGEGFYQGHAAFFIRLAGCDVGCVWCDVKESWDAKMHKHISIDELTTQVIESKCPIVIITGGEPLMYDCEALTALLQEKNIKTHIETSGSYSLSGKWNWICISPKKFKQPLQEVLKQAHELKVIIFNKSDFSFAEKHAEQVSPTCLLYLQPEWGKEKEMLPLIEEYILANPKWQLSLQIHKYLGMR